MPMLTVSKVSCLPADFFQIVTKINGVLEIKQLDCFDQKSVRLYFLPRFISYSLLIYVHNTTVQKFVDPRPKIHQAEEAYQTTSSSVVINIPFQTSCCISNIYQTVQGNKLKITMAGTTNVTRTMP